VYNINIKFTKEKNMENLFGEYSLDSDIIQGLAKQGITAPTKIQALVINPALENKDVIGNSYTGSGKTLAYLLPLFQRIDTSKREMQAIILAPTHELVMQIEAQIKLLAENSGRPMTSITIIGEASMEKQILKLRDTKPHIIVGTRGRILDLIQKKKIKAHTVKTIVIDEADKLLDESNFQGVNDIIKTTLKDRQLMAFSATLNETILNAAYSIMKTPELKRVEDSLQINPNIEHLYTLCDKRDKFEILRKLLVAAEAKRAIVFVNKSDEIELVVSKLNYHKKNAAGINSSMSKEDRKKTMNDFRNNKLNILVSSDLSARGLDFPDVTHIFNLDFPINSNDYLHRAGRTARGTASGTCISIVTNSELAAIRVYERCFSIKIEAMSVYEGKLTKAK
jgi:ATP-dependent RNA helicase DeaD